MSMRCSYLAVEGAAEQGPCLDADHLNVEDKRVATEGRRRQQQKHANPNKDTFPGCRVIVTHIPDESPAI